jgi:hypothetical protein
LEEKVAESESGKGIPSVNKVGLPKRYQKFIFKVAGNECCGKVMTKHQSSSSYRNIIGIRLKDGTEKEYDFSKDDI